MTRRLRTLHVTRGSVVERLLRFPLHYTTDRGKAEASRFMWREEQEGVYVLSALGILHATIGLTLEVREP